MFTWKPCAAHEKGHRKCPTTCEGGKWMPVESKQTACETCVARKKKCTHGLGGPKAAEIKREPDLATYQKPAGGKTKRVQEEKPASGGKKQRVQEEKPVSSIASKKAASGGKKQRVQEEKPTSNKVSKEPALGGKGAVDEEPFAFEEELDLNFWDDKKEYDAFNTSNKVSKEPALGDKMISHEDSEVRRQIKWYGAYQDPKLVEKYRVEEMAYEEQYLRDDKEVLRDMLANDDLR